MNEIFHKFAHRASLLVGSAGSFVVAAAVIVAWGVTGPLFGFSNTWQLVVNTGTTIVTFLMVFLIQNTQNRDARAIHLKLDELLRALSDARTGFVDLEDLSDAELDRLQREFEELRRLHADDMGATLAALEQALRSRRDKGDDGKNDNP